MFNDKFKKIGEDIYVYNNFISNEECIDITNFLNTLDEDKWNFKRVDGGASSTEELNGFSYVLDKLKQIVPKGFSLGSPCFYAVKMKKDDVWFPHVDVHDFEKIEKMANSYDGFSDYEEKDLSFYGLVLYFNEFEGGELVYPNQNIQYKPSMGDLVIHSSKEICLHGVKRVKSEKRYTHSNHISKKIKVAK